MCFIEYFIYGELTICLYYLLNCGLLEETVWTLGDDGDGDFLGFRVLGYYIVTVNCIMTKLNFK